MMDNFPYCTISFCPRRLDCQTEAWVQQHILLDSIDLRTMMNHCQYIVQMHKNPAHKDTYAPDLNILTPTELLQKSRQG
jgi:hypothetical protein